MQELKYYTTDDVLELLKLNRRTLYNHIRAGKIKGHKVAGKWMFTEQQIRDYVESGSPDPAESKEQFRDTLLRDTEQALKDMETYRGRLDDKFIDKEIERLNEIKRQLTE